MKIKFALALGAIMTMATMSSYAHHSQSHHKKGHQHLANQEAAFNYGGLKTSMNCTLRIASNPDRMVLSGGWDDATKQPLACAVGGTVKIGPSFKPESNMDLASLVCDMSKPVNPVDISGMGTTWYHYCTYKGIKANFDWNGIPIEVIGAAGKHYY